MLWMKALTQNGVLFRSQMYADESHALANVARHLYQTMEDFLTDCFALDLQFDEVGLRRARITSAAAAG
jgi:Holliday junction resolvasome RuvABC ATP-dependent DNA helicase subunit